jgi:hypothetical protein
MKRRIKTSAAEIARARNAVSFPALIARDVVLVRSSSTSFIARCPFHAENTPSFYVWPDHAHCFGCGWHGDTLAWLIERERMSFAGALRHLRNMSGLPEPKDFAVDHESKPEDYGWAPIFPVPTDAPPLVLRNGWTSPIYNPKSRGESDEWKIWRPASVHSYRGADGELLGNVLRCQFPSGKKFCPAVTYCVNNASERRWCLVSRFQDLVHSMGSIGSPPVAIGAQP